MSNTYLALTIGPIYKTMKMARKTREFWAASMLFSLLAKNLCKALLAKNVKKKDFLVPDTSLFDQDPMNIGLYLDRIICEVSDEKLIEGFELEILLPALDCLRNELNMVEDLNITTSELQSFFKVYAICKVVDSDTPLDELSGILNSIELYNIENSMDPVSGRIKFFLENVNTEYDDSQSPEYSNFLKKYYDQEDFNKNVRIPSIPEISTRHLSKLNSTDYRSILNRTIWKAKPEENHLFEYLKESFGTNVKNHYKYYCVLQADGDKLGSTLMKSDRKKILSISSDLIKWGRVALKELIDFGALPIYIGGDDLLCFAPVSNGTQSILDLAHSLNEKYNAMGALKNQSTLSIGIKVAYYKSPMYEAYSDTFDLLKTAKESKNTSCINLEMHSGQPHQFSFSYSGEYTDLIKPLSDTMRFDDKEKSFLSSVIYKIRANEELLFLVSGNEKRLWAFILNNFDEAKEDKNGRPVHPTKYQYLKAVMNYLMAMFSKYGNKKDDESKLYKATIQLYSALKAIRFIKGLDDDKD